MYIVEDSATQLCEHCRCEDIPDVFFSSDKYAAGFGEQQQPQQQSSPQQQEQQVIDGSLAGRNHQSKLGARPFDSLSTHKNKHMDNGFRIAPSSMSLLQPSSSGMATDLRRLIDPDVSEEDLRGGAISPSNSSELTSLGRRSAAGAVAENL